MFRSARQTGRVPLWLRLSVIHDTRGFETTTPSALYPNLLFLKISKLNVFRGTIIISVIECPSTLVSDTLVCILDICHGIDFQIQYVKNTKRMKYCTWFENDNVCPSWIWISPRLNKYMEVCEHHLNIMNMHFEGVCKHNYYISMVLIFFVKNDVMVLLLFLLDLLFSAQYTEFSPTR